MRRRQRPEPPPQDGLTDSQAAALERAVSPPGKRMDGPAFNACQDRAIELLAARWRRRVAGSFQGSDART
jgi:hypothetical protein